MAIPVNKQMLLLVCILVCLLCTQGGENKKKSQPAEAGQPLLTRQIGTRDGKQPWRPGFISACHEKPRQFSMCIPAVLRHSGISGRNFPSTRPLLFFFFFIFFYVPALRLEVRESSPALNQDSGKYIHLFLASFFFDFFFCPSFASAIS